jgi:hypothetical protein
LTLLYVYVFRITQIAAHCHTSKGAFLSQEGCRVGLNFFPDINKQSLETPVLKTRDCQGLLAHASPHRDHAGVRVRGVSLSASPTLAEDTSSHSLLRGATTTAPRGRPVFVCALLSSPKLFGVQSPTQKVSIRPGCRLLGTRRPCV